MATTIIVLPNQSMSDVIIMALGSMEGGMQFCYDNGKAISDVPVVGDVFQVSDAALTLAGSEGLSVRQYMRNYDIVIGTLGTGMPEEVLGTEDGAVLGTEDGGMIGME